MAMEMSFAWLLGASWSLLGYHSWLSFLLDSKIPKTCESTDKIKTDDSDNLEPSAALVLRKSRNPGSGWTGWIFPKPIGSAMTKWSVRAKVSGTTFRKVAPRLHNL